METNRKRSTKDLQRVSNDRHTLFVCGESISEYLASADTDKTPPTPYKVIDIIKVIRVISIIKVIKIIKVIETIKQTCKQQLKTFILLVI